MDQASPRLLVSVGTFSALALALAGCTSPAATPSPPDTTEPVAERPLPAIAVGCDELASDDSLRALVGDDMGLAFLESTPSVSDDLVVRAGGLLECRWGDDPVATGWATSYLDVSVLPASESDGAEVWLSAFEETGGCRLGRTVDDVMVTSCNTIEIVNGYWVTARSAFANQIDPTAVQERFDVLAADLVSIVGSEAAPETPGTPANPLATALCENGAATLEAAFGETPTRYVDEDSGRYDMRIAAAERAGALGCGWRVADTIWEFSIVPEATWMFDESAIQTSTGPSGSVVELADLGIEGVPAFGACDGTVCVLNALVDGSLLHAEVFGPNEIGTALEQLLAGV
jgi:hypothetical protein